MDTEIVFSTGLNVFLADNSIGKSIFFKMLKASCGIKAFSSEDIVHLITYGKNEAIALWYFSDESAGGVMVTSRGNIYLYGTNDQSLGRFDSPHPDFLRKMSLVLDVKEDFVLNILDPDQELIFVNSKASTNYTVVKLVAANEDLENLILNNEEMGARLTTLSKIAEDELKSINVELDRLGLVDIREITTQLARCEPLIQLTQDLCLLYDYLDGLSPVSSLDSLGLLSVLDLVSCLQEFSSNLGGLKLISACDYEGLLEGVKLIESLSQLYGNLTRFDKNMVQISKLDRSLYNDQMALMQLVPIVDCPVRGRVFYQEVGDCLPCSVELLGGG